MNITGLIFVGLGILMEIGAYKLESIGLMFAGAFFLLLSGISLLGKNKSTDKDTGKPFYKCPNCGGHSGKEIPKEKQDNGKEYKCIVCGYKW